MNVTLGNYVFFANFRLSLDIKRGEKFPAILYILGSCFLHPVVNLGILIHPRQGCHTRAVSVDGGQGLSVAPNCM